MLKNRLLHISFLSIVVFSVIQAVVARLVPTASPILVPQSSSERQVDMPIIETTDTDFSFSNIGVPEQGRPVGRIRGGGSR